MNTVNHWLCLLLILALPVAGQGQTYTGNPKQIEKILDNVRQFSEHVMAADYEKIADAYTDDGKLFPNNLDILEGRAAIIKYWTLPEGVSTKYHKIIPTEIRIIGKEAYDYGYYEGTTKRANGEEVSWKGKYVIVWKKVNKEWKIYLDIWNRIKE